MQRIGLLLLGMATLVASGIIMDRGRMGLNSVGGLDMQMMREGIRGNVVGDTMTREELMRQKLILDILHQVHMPLQQNDLLMMDDRTTITNEDLYMRPLTQEMHMVLNMLRNHEMLGKQTICSIHNDEHLRQMIGLYRLMVTARDFDTLMRLIVHTRQNVNTEMFVNCLVLALGERDDTRMLIVPALHEILPQLFHENRVVDQVRNLDTGVSSLRPQLMDVVGGMGSMRGMGGGMVGMGDVGLRNRLWNSRIPMQQGGGMWDVLNRSQMWMPWREMHKQMAWHKMIGRNSMVQNQMDMGNMDMRNMDMVKRDMDKMVISLPGEGLLSQDLSLKSHVNILIDELIVNQDKIRNSNSNKWGRRGVEHEVNVRGMWNNRRQMDVDYIMDDNNDMMMNTQWRRTRAVNQDDMMRSRGIMEGSRLNIDIKHAMDRNRVMMGGRRRMDNARDETEMWNMRHDNNDDMMTGGRVNNRLVMDNERRMNSNWHMGGHYMKQQQQPGINTVSINDARLLFVGTRSKNPNRVVTMDHRNNLVNENEDVMNSGGRRKNDKNERQRMWQDNEEDMKIMSKNNRRSDMMWDMENQNDDLMWNKNRPRNNMNVNSRANWQNRQILNDDDEDVLQRQGMSMNMGRGHDDFLNIINRNRMGQRQLWGNDVDVMTHHRGVDMNLPTTNIDNERLLYINRRRLNNVDDGRRVSNRLVDLDVEDDDDVVQRRNINIQRGNRNMEWSRLDEQRNWQRDNMDINNHRSKQDQREQNWGHLSVDTTSGHRYRRSLDHGNLNIGNDNTVTGKLLLHTLQQLVARLNIERISLGLPQLIEELQNNQIQGLGSMGSRLDMTTTTSRRNDIRGVDVHTMRKIENIIQRLDHVIQQRIQEISHLQHNEKINEIGLMLAGQIEETGLIELLKEVLQQPLEKGQIANLIENQAVQMLLAGIVKVADHQIQLNSKQDENIINTVPGVTIHNVEVDRLQTHMELTEVDLSNIFQELKHNQVVGRVPRLNHKTFNIQVEVTSERTQQVMVRHLLIPKVNNQGHLIPLKERRQNVIVLDVNTVELHTGLNTLTLRSHDNTLTSPDTTPLTKIYQMVMQALNGNIMLHKHNLQGQTNMLPHHLLLPRGRVNGLPMQLITAITPIERMDNMMLNHMNGLTTLLLDRLPLNYPMHCDINDLERVMSMPNVMVKDVMIYHDDQMKMMHLN